MDLQAYVNKFNDKVDAYIKKHYGEVPRNRGILFMRTEEKIPSPRGREERMFNKYAGQDVVYIHTRCGHCGKGYKNSESNYVYYGAKDWEENHKDLFLSHANEKYDKTYCTPYFKAVVDDDYNEIIESLKGEEEEE